MISFISSKEVLVKSLFNQSKMKKSVILFVVLLIALVFAAITENKINKTNNEIASVK